MKRGDDFEQLLGFGKIVCHFHLFGRNKAERPCQRIAALYSPACVCGNAFVAFPVKHFRFVRK